MKRRRSAQGGKARSADHSTVAAAPLPSMGRARRSPLQSAAWKTAWYWRLPSPACTEAVATPAWPWSWATMAARALRSAARSVSGEAALK